MRFLSNLPSTTNKLLDSPAASRNKFNTTHTTNMSFDQSRLSQQRNSKRDALIKTGYNSGFQKGTFATQLNGREYFEMYIRP